MLLGTAPSCIIKACRALWIVVERCDTCERFADDVAAALSQFTIAGWFQCDDGGWHALADSGSRHKAPNHRPFIRRGGSSPP